MILIITYDLKSPKDYHDFYEAIKAQGTQGKWWHYMASTWLLSTTKTPQQVVDAIRPLLDPQDFLFVCEISPNYQGWLPKPAWEWLRTELPQPDQLNFLALIAQGMAKDESPSNALADAARILGGMPTVKKP